MANILVTGSKGQLGTELRKTGFTLLDEVFIRICRNWILQTSKRYGIL